MKHVGLIVCMLHFEAVASILYIRIWSDSVIRDVDVSLDLDLLDLKSASALEENEEVDPNCVVIILHLVKVVPSQHAIPMSPQNVVLLLHQPTVTNASFAHQDFTNLVSKTCVRDMKKTRKQLAFHRTSNTSKSTTSYSNPQDHSNPHSSTGDGGARDDNAKKSSHWG